MASEYRSATYDEPKCSPATREDHVRRGTIMLVSQIRGHARIAKRHISAWPGHSGAVFDPTGGPQLPGSNPHQAASSGMYEPGIPVELAAYRPIIISERRTDRDGIGGGSGESGFYGHLNRLALNKSW